jgi:multidrug resistance efflux pump
VASGQLLARLDGRDLRLELASLEAERSRVAKERDRSMAASDTAASQLAALELRRLDLKREGIDARLQRLEIRSPLAGQVIGGDPQVWVGSRLTQGQSLVEVAAPGTLVLELSIPDADIDRAIVGKTVHCRLESLPGVSLEGRLKSIRPRAEVRDGENVFVGQVELRISPEGDHSELRPGMRGRARLEAEPRTLAWQVFHRAWEQLQFRWGW